jgi:cellulose synthase/poly-beta-1,6-N-acetylglucosamine synthase-like glycosyltransferase
MTFLLNAVGVLLLLLIFPLVVELAVLTLAAIVYAIRVDVFHATPRILQKPVVSPPPSLIVLIPAHNEAQLIARTVHSLLDAAAADLAPVRICVIAHNCTDATAVAAKTAGAEVLELSNPSLSGKGNALLFGFTRLAPSPADADKFAFVVIDADTVVERDLFSRIQQAISHGAEAVQCRYEALHYNAAGHSTSSLAALAFRGFNTIRARGRAQLGLSCGIYGNGFALRASLLQRIAYNAHSVVEDLEYHIALVRAGVRVEYLDGARLNGEITGTRSQKSRWDGGRARMAAQWMPSLAKDVFCGRLRMLGPIFYITSLPLAQGVLLMLIALALPPAWLRITAATSLLIVLLHVLTAIFAGEHPADDLRLLLRLPMYLLAKITALPATLLMSRSNAAWVRTSRDNEISQPDKTPAAPQNHDIR